MFYISSKSNDGLLGVTDLKDGVEEYHSLDNIKNIITSTKIDI